MSCPSPAAGVSCAFASAMRPRVGRASPTPATRRKNARRSPDAAVRNLACSSELIDGPPGIEYELIVTLPFSLGPSLWRVDLAHPNYLDGCPSAPGVVPGPPFRVGHGNG